MHALLASKLTSTVRATLSCIMISSFFVQSLYLTNYKINTWRRFFVWKDESKIRANNFSSGFQANWYRASQYCRYHGMHLASIASQEENDRLEKHIKDFGLGHEHFWTSGTDQAEEGTFFWMANGRPITFENWNVGEPNNFRWVHSRCSVIYRKTLFFARNEVFDRVWRKCEARIDDAFGYRYENGEEEHCLELWNRDGKGLKWNDSPCSFETFFVCEVQWSIHPTTRLTRIFEDHRSTRLDSRYNVDLLPYRVVQPASYCPIDSSPSRPSNEIEQNWLVTCVYLALDARSRCTPRNRSQSDETCVKILLRNYKLVF